MKLIIVACTALFFGAVLGFMTCAVLSASRTDEEWEEMVRQKHGEVHQEES